MNGSVKGAALLLAVVASGCSSNETRMPLEKGRTVSYVVKTDFATWVEPITISQRIPLEGTNGAEFTGPLGSARMVWKNGVLLVQSSANGRFFPPFPILASDGKDRKWEGRIETLGEVQVASARLQQKPDKVRIGTREISTTLSTVTMTLPGGDVVLESWFQPEFGLVQQVQRTNGRRVLYLQLLTGP